MENLHRDMLDERKIVYKGVDISLILGQAS